MIANKIEDFTIKKCPVCGNSHHLKVDVFRDELPNDFDKDIRVPEMRKINVRVICPAVKDIFTMDLFFQEDKFSKIIKLRRPV